MTSIGAIPRVYTPAANTTQDPAQEPPKAGRAERDGVLDGVLLGGLLGGNPVAVIPNASAGAKLAGLVVGMGVGAVVGGAVDAMFQDNDPSEWGPFDDYLKF